MIASMGSLPSDLYSSQISSETSAYGTAVYDAIEPRGRRRPPSGDNRSEELILNQRKRDQVTSQAKDLHRNLSLLTFMVERHLDYNTLFDLECSTGPGNGSFDDDFLQFVEAVSDAARFDAGGRHDLNRFLRIMEGRCILDGDCGALQIADGTLQGIEGDDVRNPTSIPKGQKWSNGVQLGPANRSLAYAIQSESEKGKSRIVPAQRFFLRGSFARFKQCRGVSPIVSAHNTLRDVDEGVDYELAKRKVESLFAMAIFREATSAAGPLFGEEDAGTGRRKYKVDFGTGPVLLDLDPGDDVKFLSSNSPSPNVTNFISFVVMLAMKSMGMPYSFFDGSSTNFHGGRADAIHYERHCVPIRQDNAKFLNWWLAWRTQLAVQDGDLKLPRGLTLRRPWWQWIPRGTPWFQPDREANGDILAIRGGLTSPQRVTRARGNGNVFQILDEIAEVKDYASKKGVSLEWSPIPMIVGPNEEFPK